MEDEIINKDLFKSKIYFQNDKAKYSHRKIANFGLLSHPPY